jgi:predicted phosphodiesterase
MLKKRLCRTYENAKRIKIDEDSKIILFSDCHRGDNSFSDEFAHNQNIYFYALSYYFKNEFTYIELGDGDELWEHKDFKYIRNAHSDIFELLKDYHDEERLHMIYGNHNLQFKYPWVVKRDLHSFFEEMKEEREPLFEGLKVQEAIILESENQGEIFLIHGHQGDIFNDYLWFIARFLMRYFWKYAHIIGFRNPTSPAKNRSKRHKVEKRLSQWIVREKKILIAGHTHRAKFPEVGEIPYFNDGCCVHPRAITGIEIEHMMISLVEWRIVPKDDGQLVVEKKVLKGPKELRQYWNSF